MLVRNSVLGMVCGLLVWTLAAVGTASVVVMGCNRLPLGVHRRVTVSHQACVAKTTNANASTIRGLHFRMIGDISDQIAANVSEGVLATPLPAQP